MLETPLSKILNWISLGRSISDMLELVVPCVILTSCICSIFNVQLVSIQFLGKYQRMDACSTRTKLSDIGRRIVNLIDRLIVQLEQRVDAMESRRRQATPAPVPVTQVPSYTT